MCSSAMRKMICTLGEHGRDQTRARQECVRKMARERTEQFVLRRWWLTIARTHEGSSGLEQCWGTKAEKRCGILRIFQG